MASRKKSLTNNRNNHLEEAMALLISNQAAFVEQVARNDQERLKLQRSHDELERKSGELERETKETFAKVEKRLSRIETILLQLPKAIKKEIGFKTQT